MLPQSSNEKKYLNCNPLHRFLLNRFLDAANAEIRLAAPRSILDFGCGEGVFLQAMQRRGLELGIKILGVDMNPDAVMKAQSRLPEYVFADRDVMSLPLESDRFDLVLAVEVLEHLQDAERYVQRLSNLCSGRLLFSVPCEPWFMLLNLVRGRDVARFGNHPEHVRHWSRRSFHHFLLSFIAVERCYVRFPWIIAVGKPIT